MRYRAEIDGLRALAVLPVILFHAGFPTFGGGFVGVDVFFVISGFLITLILRDELERENLSIVRFYERRARRILPALVFVVLCCVPFAWVWMLPEQFLDFAQSVAAVALFGSNVLFANEAGYFALDSELKPLLHTWSLAVEEQYYLLFPPLLALAWKLGRRSALTLIVLTALASFAVSEWGWRNDPTSNFYLLPGRAWELLAGSIAAFAWADGRLRRNGFAGLAGLAMIVLSIFVYAPDTPFPSYLALLPVGGTVLVLLFARDDTLAGKLLAQRWLVGIGLISYSAYLWHQPILAFARLRMLHEPSPLVMAGLCLMALLLAWPTWAFVERPFRKPGYRPLPTRGSVFVASGVVLAILGASGAIGIITEGRNANFRTMAEPRGYSDGCYFNSLPTDKKLADCLSVIGDRPHTVLIGDSHAQSIAREMHAALAAEGHGLITMAVPGCFPLPGTQRAGVAKPKRCSDLSGLSYDLAISIKPASIIVAVRWTYYATGTRYLSSHGFLEPGEPVTIIESVTDKIMDRPIDRMADHLVKVAGKVPVLLLGPIPEVGIHVQRLALFRPDLGSYPYQDYLDRNAITLEALDRLAQLGARIAVVDPSRVLCPATDGERRCQQIDGTVPLYRDDDHINTAGARRVAPVVVETMRANGLLGG